MPSDPVTIVSGLPRSGTSMLMQMVVAAGIPALTDGIRTADEDNPNGYFEFEPVKRTRHDPSWLNQARGKVVKMVHILLADLPPGYEFQVILMERDLEEVLASQFRMLSRTGRPGHVPPETLQRLYAAQLETVRRGLDARPGTRWIEMNYNRILASPAEECARLAAFLGRPDAAARMAGVVDASLYRNRT